MIVAVLVLLAVSTSGVYGAAECVDHPEPNDCIKIQRDDPADEWKEYGSMDCCNQAECLGDGSVVVASQSCIPLSCGTFQAEIRNYPTVCCNECYSIGFNDFFTIFFGAGCVDHPYHQCKKLVKDGPFAVKEVGSDDCCTRAFCESSIPDGYILQAIGCAAEDCTADEIFTRTDPFICCPACYEP